MDTWFPLAIALKPWCCCCWCLGWGGWLHRQCCLSPGLSAIDCTIQCRHRQQFCGLTSGGYGHWVGDVNKALREVTAHCHGSLGATVIPSRLVFVSSLVLLSDDQCLPMCKVCARAVPSSKRQDHLNPACPVPIPGKCSLHFCPRVCSPC